MKVTNTNLNKAMNQSTYVMLVKKDLTSQQSQLFVVSAGSQ